MTAYMTFFLTEQHFLYKTVFSGESSLRLKNQKKKKFGIYLYWALKPHHIYT